MVLDYEISPRADLTVFEESWCLGLNLWTFGRIEEPESKEPLLTNEAIFEADSNYECIDLVCFLFLTDSGIWKLVWIKA